MKISSRAYQRLCSKFPFLKEIVEHQHIEPAPLRYGKPDKVSVQTKVADGKTLFKYANNSGLTPNSGYICSLEKKRKGQIMRQCEVLFVIDRNNKIVNRQNWPAYSGKPLYVKDALWKTTDGKIGGWIPKYLVWVTASSWHKDRQINDRFGLLMERRLDIIIYTAPEDEFSELEQNSSLEDNVLLSNNVMVQAFENPELQLINGRLAELALLFQEEVYLNGLQEEFSGYQVRGASGSYEGVKFLMGEMCGYSRIQLENKHGWVSLQIRPDSQSVYICGLGGTLPCIRHLIKTICKGWTALNRGWLKPNKNIGII